MAIKFLPLLDQHTMYILLASYCDIPELNTERHTISTIELCGISALFDIFFRQTSKTNKSWVHCCHYDVKFHSIEVFIGTPGQV